MSNEKSRDEAQAALLKSRNMRELLAKIKMACAANKLQYKPERGPPNRVKKANEDAMQSILGVIPEEWVGMALAQQDELLDMQLPAQEVRDPFNGAELRLSALQEGHSNYNFEFYVDGDDVTHRMPIRGGHAHLGLIYYIAVGILELDPTITVESALTELHDASFNEHKTTPHEWATKINCICVNLRRSRSGEDKIPKEVKIKIILGHLYNAKPKGDKMKWKRLVERIAHETSIVKILSEVRGLGKVYERLNLGGALSVNAIEEKENADPIKMLAESVKTLMCEVKEIKSGRAFQTNNQTNQNHNRNNNNNNNNNNNKGSREADRREAERAATAEAGTTTPRTARTRAPSASCQVTT